jgi:hypothetical protein
MMFHNAPYANELGYNRNGGVTVADVASDACDLAADPPVPPSPPGAAAAAAPSPQIYKI